MHEARLTAGEPALRAPIRRRDRAAAGSARVSASPSSAGVWGRAAPPSSSSRLDELAEAVALGDADDAAFGVDHAVPASELDCEEGRVAARVAAVLAGGNDAVVFVE